MGSDSVHNGNCPSRFWSKPRFWMAELGYCPGCGAIPRLGRPSPPLPITPRRPGTFALPEGCWVAMPTGRTNSQTTRSCLRRHELGEHADGRGCRRCRQLPTRDRLATSAATLPHVCPTLRPVAHSGESVERTAARPAWRAFAWYLVTLTASAQSIRIQLFSDLIRTYISVT